MLCQRTQNPADRRSAVPAVARVGHGLVVDRLRLWLERGATPEQSLRSALLDAGGRISVCAIAGYEGSIAHAVIGVGAMDTVWHGRGFVRPFLALGARRNILVRERARRCCSPSRTTPIATRSAGKP
jgi:hypothetical protein